MKIFYWQKLRENGEKNHGEKNRINLGQCEIKQASCGFHEYWNPWKPKLGPDLVIRHN